MEWQAAVEALLPVVESSMIAKTRIGGSASLRGTMKTVWIYVGTRKEVGDIDHLKVFATARAAEEWFEESDPNRRCL
jgi:hypothetical protein